MASKRLGVGMIGGGFVGKFHIRSFVGIRDADIIGVVSRKDGTGEEAAALGKSLGVGEPKLFDSVTDMVADPSIDAALIDAGHAPAGSAETHDAPAPGEVEAGFSLEDARLVTHVPIPGNAPDVHAGSRPEGSRIARDARLGPEAKHEVVCRIDVPEQRALRQPVLEVASDPLGEVSD